LALSSLSLLHRLRSVAAVAFDAAAEHHQVAFYLQVKELFKKMDVDAKIVELDSVVEGDDVQARARHTAADRLC